MSGIRPELVGWVEPKAKPINLSPKMGFAFGSTHPTVAHPFHRARQVMQIS
jgi:hypothetical protein